MYKNIRNIFVRSNLKTNYNLDFVCPAGINELGN